jgi:hypothetical protein
VQYQAARINRPPVSINLSGLRPQAPATLIQARPAATVTFVTPGHIKNVTAFGDRRHVNETPGRCIYRQKEEGDEHENYRSLDS